MRLSAEVGQVNENVRTKAPSLFTPVLLVGCVIVLVGFAIRASFGVFQIPIQEEFGAEIGV